MKRLFLLACLISSSYAATTAAQEKEIPIKRPLRFYFNVGAGLSKTDFGHTSACFINLGAPFYVSKRSAIDLSTGLAFKKKKAPSSYEGYSVVGFSASPQITVMRVLYKFFLKPKPTTFFVAAGLGTYCEYYKIKTDRSSDVNQLITLEPGKGVYLEDGSLWGDRHITPAIAAFLAENSEVTKSYWSVMITPEIQVGFQFASNIKRAPRGILTLAASLQQIYFSVGIGF